MNAVQAVCAAACLNALAAPGEGQAHHSFAMFDAAKTLTVTGVVKEFDWTNPHVALFVYGAADRSGPDEVWAVELTSPGNLKRYGWSRDELKVGDKIVIQVHPLRDGQHGGEFVSATLSETGKVLKNGTLVIG